MNSAKISASLMCARLMHLATEVEALRQAGVDYLHFDFMDGQFVPNLTFGTAFLRAYRRLPFALPLDIHIMAHRPEQYFDAMEIGPGDLVSFHFEATNDPQFVIDDLRKRGACPLLAVHPDTPLQAVSPLLPLVDGAVVMTVYPGDAGKPLVAGSFDRIAQMRRLLNACPTPKRLEVDGCVSWQNAPFMRQAGADLFVVGSSSVFEAKGNYDQAVARFLQILA